MMTQLSKHMRWVSKVCYIFHRMPGYVQCCSGLQPLVSKAVKSCRKVSENADLPFVLLSCLMLNQMQLVIG
jgi:hypothetical protein